MANGAVFTAELEKQADFPGTSSDSLSSLFQRRIEFHPARKPFKRFDNGGGDFRLETLNPSSSFAPKSGSNLDRSAAKGKLMDGSDFLENGLDPELSFEITYRRIGAGLQNLGNTCFLNSVLQCLTYTEPLAAYLQSGKHQTSCHVAGFCALCAIQKHVSSALQSNGRILAPKDLVSNLRCISRNFRNARQEDAHEYMVNLLESMHKCCLPSGLPSESPSAYEKSLVHKIFGGRLRSQVKCMQCSYCSNKFDPFLDLSLDIMKADSLHKAFKNFTTPELLDGGERQYQCQQCKQKVKALKQLTVHKAPYVLTIHLKRFQSYNLEEKIHKKIQFGPTLDLKPFVSDSYADGDLKYTLYGVLVHHGGSTRSGHYYCYVRTSSGMWYALDDNQVSHVGDRTVFEQQAYMLFYVRDRRKVVQKKSVDIALKENLTTNSSLNRTALGINQSLKDCEKNHILEKRKGSSSTGPSKPTVLKEPSVQIETEQVNKERLVRNDASIPTSSSEGALALSLKPLGKNIIPSSSPAEDLPSSTRCLSSNLVAPNSESSLAKATDIGICHVNGGSSVSVATSFNLSAANASGIAQNDNPTSTPDSGYKMSEKPDSEILSDQPMSESSSKVEILNQNAVGNLFSEDASNCNKPVPNESNKISSSSIIADGSLLMKTLDCKRGRRLKRKQLKYHLASLHLSSKVLFKASLSLGKKKKSKRRRHRSVGSENLTEERFFNRDCTLSDVGPSTSSSEKSNTVQLDSTRKSKKKAKHGAKGGHGTSVEKGNNKVEVLTDIVYNECQKRSKDGYSVLATENCSITVANQNESSEANCSKDRKRTADQDGLHGVPFHGFENTVVEQWDGIASKKEFNRMENSIGYVADEWDEEYDQGKRKKIRQFKHSFGEPNPFQEIASKKSQMKMSKLMNRSISGNVPFRI